MLSEIGATVNETEPASTAHVLVVDDDPSVRELIVDYLSDNDIKVTALSSGHQLADVMQRETFDLLVLDVRMPGQDGMQIAQKLRETSQLPIIMLTSRRDEADRVMGLELGADDYLTKPFSPRELLAHIRALLRRARAQQTPAEGPNKVRAYRFAGFELNMGRRRLKGPGGEDIPLSNGEFNLLAAFLGSPQRVLSRDQLLGLSRLRDGEVFDRAVDVQIGRLRKKIKASEDAPELIQTERGAGYVFTTVVEIVR